MVNYKNGTPMNISASNKTSFSKSFSLLLNLGLFFTGLLGVIGVIFIGYCINKQLWIQIGLNAFINQSLYYLINLILFITLCTIKQTKRPFTNCITIGMRVISTIFFLISVVAPRFSSYELSGFQLLSNGSSTLIDGLYFEIGLIFIIFSGIFKYGYKMQKEEDLTV